MIFCWYGAFLEKSLSKQKIPFEDQVQGLYRACQNDATSSLAAGLVAIFHFYVGSRNVFYSIFSKFNFSFALFLKSNNIKSITKIKTGLDFYLK